MNKSELIESVAKEFEVSRGAATMAVDAVFSNVQRALKRREPVRIAGFGVFTVRQRRARVGHNPRTLAQIKIKASKAVGFKAGTTLKAAVNGGR